MDDKGDHILVDDDFNITAIIDWQWVRTTTKAETFSAPLFLLDVYSFYDDNNAFSDHENAFIKILEKRSKYDLAAFVRNGRYQHCIAFSIGGHVEDNSLKQLFEGFLKLQLGRKQGSIVWDEWRGEALVKYHGERELMQFMEEGTRPDSRGREPSGR
jgi:hypothetical protein